MGMQVELSKSSKRKNDWQFVGLEPDYGDNKTRKDIKPDHLKIFGEYPGLPRPEGPRQVVVPHQIAPLVENEVQHGRLKVAGIVDHVPALDGDPAAPLHNDLLVPLAVDERLGTGRLFVGLEPHKLA